MGKKHRLPAGKQHSLIGAAHVQVRYDSQLLELLTLIPVAVAVVRSVLGYRRMAVRYENVVNDMIASKTVAQERAALPFLAAAAAEQRLAAAALAYGLLSSRRGSADGMAAAALGAAAEAALAGVDGGAGVLFDADGALAVLAELGLAQGAGAGGRWRAVPLARADAALAAEWHRLLHACDDGA